MPSGQRGFRDVEERLQELTARDNPLEKPTATVEFENFAADLDAALKPRDPSKAAVRREMRR